MSDFKLPDLGEGLKDARIVEWHVKLGQEVSAGDDLISVETAKAIVDIPAPFSGRVVNLAVNNNDLVDVGEVLLTIDTESSDNTQVPVATQASDKKIDAPDSEKTDEPTARSDNRANLGIVGSVVAPQQPDRATTNDIHKEILEPASGKQTEAQNQRLSNTSDPSQDNAATKAMPAVRRKAVELGINLNDIVGSGPHQSITTADLENYSTQHSAKQQAKAERSPTSVLTESSVKTTDISDRMNQPLRQRMATVMRASADQVVPATVNEMADIHKLPADTDLTVIALQSIVYASAQEPALNAWFDTKSASLEPQNSVHVAIAVDTAAGLLAPVVKGADLMNGHGLREQLDQILTHVRSGKASPSELTGATVTLSNFGSIGGMYASLVIPPPTVAIVGIGRARDMVVCIDGAIAVHRLLPVSLTFDHRAVTGGEATRFLMAFIAYFESPSIDCLPEQHRHD